MSLMEGTQAMQTHRNKIPSIITSKHMEEIKSISSKLICTGKQEDENIK